LKTREQQTKALLAAACFALAAALPARLLYVLLVEPTQRGIALKDSLLQFLALSTAVSSLASVLGSSAVIAFGFAVLSVWQLLCARRGARTPSALKIVGAMLTAVSVPASLLSAIFGGFGLWCAHSSDGAPGDGFLPTEPMSMGQAEDPPARPAPLLTPMLSIFLRVVATATAAAGLVVAGFFWLNGSGAALVLPLVVLVPVMAFHRKNTGLLLGLAALSVVLGFSSCAANFRWGGG
jgi:hypothetical protein